MRILYIFFIIIFGTAGFSQEKKVYINLPTIALLDIEGAGNKDIVMNFSAPTEAGHPLTLPGDNNSLWLNYTSAVASGNKRTISASISTVIPGIDIKLSAGSASGGGGDLGIPTSITLDTSPKTLISDIGGAFTGGTGSGHQLNYSLGFNTYGNLEKTNATITVTFTLSN